MKRLHGLDALRGVAALAVVVWHWRHFYDLPGAATGELPFFWALKPLYDAGWAAVDLFFALSGFVFFWLYAQAIGSRQIGAGKFALLRFSRLYPLHFATLILVVVLELVFHRQTGHDFVYDAGNWRRFAVALVMAQQWLPPTEQLFFNGPAWSVSIEILLYVLFFIVCRLGLAGPRIGLWIAAAAAVVFALGLNELIARGVMSFFLGGAVFHGVAWARARPDAPRTARLLAGLAIAAWTVMLVWDYWHPLQTGASLPGAADSYVHSSDNRFVLPFVLIVGPLTIAALALHEQLYGLRWAALSFLGDISYSTYLLHFPLQMVCVLLALHFGWTSQEFMHPLAMLAFFAVLVALATLSHYGFERPLQALIRSGASGIRRVTA